MKWGFRKTTIQVNGDRYMDRWEFRTPFFTVRLHHILRSDQDRELHDHPWDFTSLILSAGYWEYRPARAGRLGLSPPFCEIERRWCRPLSVVCRKAEDAHRLELTRPVWTLVITGRKRRDWGFYTKDGWVHWRQWSAQ